MKPDSFEDAIAKYEKRTGETFYWSPDLTLKTWDNNNEFMLWKLAEIEGTKYFYVDQTYGTSKSITVFIIDVMKKNNIKDWIMATCRNPKPFMRKWQMERLPDRDYEYEDRCYFVLKGDVDNLH